MKRLSSVIVTALVALVLHGAPAAAQMPDIRQMSGTPLPSGDLPDGAISVRVVRQSLGNNVPGAQVSLTGGGVSETASTDENGRAFFSGLTAGTNLTAAVSVDGETVRSQPFAVPARGGVRLILAVGLDGGARGGTTPAGPAAPAVPARPGTIVLGNQTRSIIDFNNERLEVVHIFEFANATATPVSVPAPVTISMPADAEQVTLLDGSSTQARVFERQLVVAGPFSAGRTMVQVAYVLPMAGARREIALTLPLASMSTNVILRRLGDTKLVEPVLPQSRDAQAQGRTYFTGTGPGLPAGGTLRLVVEGLPHHPRWPRYTALGLAGLVVAAGLWVIFRVPVDSASRIKALDAQRTALLARLQQLEQGGRAASEEGHAERDTLLRDLEGIYALLDAERTRRADRTVERRAS